MLTLMFSLVQYTRKYMKKYLNEVEDIDTVISHIEHIRKEEERDIVKKTLNKEGCYYKNGIITCVTADYVLIDNKHIYEKNDELSSNLEIGDNVYYSALLRDPKEKVKVIKIIHKNEIKDKEPLERKEIRNSILQKSMIAKVKEREGRFVMVEPDIRINLNKVQSEFIPLIGDWIILESLTEVSDSQDESDNILEVDKIKPLRSKLNVGVITKYDSLNQVGVIDKSIIFHKSACEPGYIPCVNDKVVSDSIESDQGIHKWRSLTVVPLNLEMNKISHCSVMSNFYSELSSINDLLKNKNDIIIDDELKFNLNIEEEDNLTVTICNTGNCAQVLQNGTFMSQETSSQLSVISPTNTDVNMVINPSKSISYTFKCKARFIGKSEELFIFNFKDFKIGRLFHITTNAINVSQNGPSTSVPRKNNQKINLDNLNKEDDLTYIPGVKPYKTTFFRMRNGVFNVPQYIWNVILNNMVISQAECKANLERAVPSLLKQLTFNIYKERFHALLYLEEVAQILNIQQYNMQNVKLQRYRDYFTLHVPGLVEKRPSLLVGDRAVATVIPHRLTKQGYELDVKTLNRLGPEILFPTKVIEKEPLFHLEEYDIEEKPINTKQICNEANESMSSTDSSNSIASGSDTSLESTTRTSPRISVVERLFKVKPVESPPKKTETSSTKIESNLHLQTNTAKCDNNNKIDGVSNTASEKANEQINQTNDELKPYIDQIKKRKLNWFNKGLNYYQKEAVWNIMKGVARPLPYVIFGPPGTGKTVTLCETILQIFTAIPDSRLLVATPSNSSANLITERLLDSNILNPGDLVRLIAHHCLYDDSIPEKLMPFCAAAELGDEKIYQMLRTHKIDLVQSSDDEESFDDERKKRFKCNFPMSTLGRHRITIGTCSTLGILHNMGFPHGHFSHVLVDEAGQATEPEIMIPLSFIHADEGQVILVGDPMQLGPVVQSNLATYYGLSESFLSRLLHQFPYQRDEQGFENYYDPRLITKLIINYRSLPEILELSNWLFYDSELLPQISPKKSKEAKVLKRLKEILPSRNGLPPAVIFHGISGENRRDIESPSWYNPEEATQVYIYLMKLYKCGLEPDDIGVITPYLKQVMQIRDLLNEINMELPKISSVEGFQGQERKVIILSTVRSCNKLIDLDVKHALGFVASPKRLNVAITRARALLIIVGNPKLLYMDPHWRSVLMYCVKHGGYTGCNFQPNFYADLLSYK
ncbi:probable RNA helicase armi isoform X2 [Harpegnathos saltator]|uniref:probable RNA helicase armi isoform X2 n=1 Tax=Harpegnathos saltator TaxID=610380 RepID=UPI000DBEE366|nr:probable RNA helicase armi isoform X2 [Harpegnathos saltator]